MNLIMPSLDNTLGNFKKEIENEIKIIFKHIVKHV